MWECMCPDLQHVSVWVPPSGQKNMKRDRQREIMLIVEEKKEGKKNMEAFPPSLRSLFLSSHIYIFSCQWPNKESSSGFDELVTSMSFVKDEGRCLFS